MAHFAQIDENNNVINILVVPDEQEHRGQEYLSVNLGLGGRWIQTSYNNNIRKMYAGIGYFYNEDLDIFMPPKPFPSWIVDTNKGEWCAPISRPSDQEGKAIIWDEENQNWIIQDLPIPIL